MPPARQVLRSTRIVAGTRPVSSRSSGAGSEILAEQRRAGRGSPVPAEELLRRWPTDPAADPDAASLLAEDYFQRRRRGEDPSLNDYKDHFPDQSRSLASLVSRQTLSRPGHHRGHRRRHVRDEPGATLRLPDVGDEVFGFRLKHSLGQGAFARVYLAGQDHLGAVRWC
ncbi:MAG: hypothetical protein WKF75_03495 [Singulisphaera sp.]